MPHFRYFDCHKKRVKTSCYMASEALWSPPMRAASKLMGNFTPLLIIRLHSLLHDPVRSSHLSMRQGKGTNEFSLLLMIVYLRCKGNCTLVVPVFKNGGPLGSIATKNSSEEPCWVP